MENNYKRTFDAVNMPQERWEQIRAALSSHISEKRKDNDIMNTKSIAYRKPRVALIAAVIALSCILLAGAAYAYGTQIIELLGGGRIESGKINGTDYNSISTGFASDPVELREGRVYFLLDGSNMDITSYCTEETAYRYERITDDGYRHVVLVGGTPDNLGWAEFVWDENGNEVGGNATYNSDKAPAWLNNEREKLGLGVWGGLGAE